MLWGEAQRTESSHLVVRRNARMSGMQKGRRKRGGEETGGERGERREGGREGVREGGKEKLLLRELSTFGIHPSQYLLCI